MRLESSVSSWNRKDRTSAERSTEKFLEIFLGKAESSGEFNANLFVFLLGSDTYNWEDGLQVMLFGDTWLWQLVTY
jgi:hypothetical protein